LQEHNVGVGDYGTEMDRMRQVANAARQRLEARGVAVRMSPKCWAYLDPNDTLYRVVKHSNEWGADLHICIHSNAGPKGADGTMTMYYPGSVEGRRIATLIQNRVAPLSPGSDIGLVTYPVFYETRAAKAPVAYLELAFHTNYADAQSVIDHHTAYGRAIAEACLVYLARRPKVPAAPAVKPAKPAKPAWWRKWRRWLRLDKRRH
jgi:N-acetylmuramoyl-L-alanine amidase